MTFGDIVEVLFASYSSMPPSQKDEYLYVLIKQSFVSPTGRQSDTYHTC